MYLLDLLNQPLTNAENFNPMIILLFLLTVVLLLGSEYQQQA